jgi:hypothetical protein
MTDQATLFGPAPTPKVKAKALPKVESKPKPTVSKLTPQQQREAAANIAALKKSRARLKVGDLEIAEGACEQCGGERIQELMDIHPIMGRYWEARCLRCVKD